MSNILFTHRQIEAFRSVMLTGSMKEAARLLSVTQPAVSKIMTQLEQALGFALFERRQGRLRPLEEAYILYAEVERSYRGLERVGRTAQHIRDRSGGNLRLGVLPTFATGFLTQLLERFYADGIAVQLSIQAYNSEEIVDLVASGLCDLGFAMTPVDATRVRAGPVMSVPSYCVLPPGHALAAKQVVSVLDMHGERFIATAEGTSSRLRTDALFTSMNVVRNISIEARWSTTIADLVQAGFGCGIVDGFTAWTIARRGGIVRPLQERLDFTFVSVTPLVSTESAVVRSFHEAFEAEFSNFREKLVHYDFSGE